MLYFPLRYKLNKPLLADLEKLLASVTLRLAKDYLSSKASLVTNSFIGNVAYRLRSIAAREMKMSKAHREWYVVYSKPHREEQVRFHLALKGIESFFPRLQVPGYAGRKKGIAPLFPNYLFVRVDLASEAHYVIWSPGVKRIVSFSDRPVPLEESVIQFLKERADSDGIIKAKSGLSAGEQVEIIGGPFNGFVGIIENPPNAKGRVQILLKLLSRQISVKLGVEFIRNQSVAIAPAVTIGIERADLVCPAS
jgi:transcriptional antiterminator RfaH